MSAPGSADRARQWLETQLTELGDLRNASPRDPSFKLWRQNTLTVLQRIWPGEAARSERFRRIPFSPASARHDGAVAREWYTNGCEEAASYLRALVTEIESVGVPGADTVRTNAPARGGDHDDAYPVLDLASGQASAPPPATGESDEIVLLDSDGTAASLAPEPSSPEPTTSGPLTPPQLRVDMKQLARPADPPAPATPPAPRAPARRAAASRPSQVTPRAAQSPRRAAPPPAAPKPAPPAAAAVPPAPAPPAAATPAPPAAAAVPPAPAPPAAATPAPPAAAAAPPAPAPPAAAKPAPPAGGPPAGMAERRSGNDRRVTTRPGRTRRGPGAPKEQLRDMLGFSPEMLAGPPENVPGPTAPSPPQADPPAAAPPPRAAAPSPAPPAAAPPPRAAAPNPAPPAAAPPPRAAAPKPAPPAAAPPPRAAAPSPAPPAAAPPPRAAAPKPAPPAPLPAPAAAPAREPAAPAPPAPVAQSPAPTPPVSAAPPAPATPPASPPADGGEAPLDPDTFEQAAQDFMRNSPVLSLQGKPVQRASDATRFLDPDAVAIATLAGELARHVPEPSAREPLRESLLLLAQQFDANTPDWPTLRAVVAGAMAHPELARRLMPIVLPWLTRAA